LTRSHAFGKASAARREILENGASGYGMGGAAAADVIVIYDYEEDV
jgi:hypothetical protein